MLSEEQVALVQLEARDPETMLCGHPAPALTAILYKVCGGDHEKFGEVCRLIDIIIDKVLEKERETNFPSN